MSERLSHNPEALTPTPEATPKHHKAAEYTKAEQEAHIEQAQAAVAAEVRDTERPHVPQAPVDDRPQLIDNAVKMFRMRRNLSHVQKRLKPAEKSFSKLIHQPLISRVSETSAKTISRPSGMLGGGMTAFLGSLLYLFVAHRYELAYNYLVFLLFFAAGFVLGIALEYTAYGLRRLRRS